MDEPVAGVLSHAALFYRSQAEYAAKITAFVRAGLAQGEPALIALPGDKARTIGARLDAMPGRAGLRGHDRAGPQPGADHPGGAGIHRQAPRPARALCRRADLARALGRGDLRGDPARGSDQPRVRAGRGDYFVSIRCCGAGRFRPRRCPAHAPGTSSVRRDGPDLAGQPSPGLRPPACPPPADAEALAYETDLAPVRRLVERHARRAGLGEERTVDLVLAANEIAANTISHTAGGGVIHVWHTGEEILCQVHDQGGSPTRWPGGSGTARTTVAMACGWSTWCATWSSCARAEDGHHGPDAHAPGALARESQRCPRNPRTRYPGGS